MAADSSRKGALSLAAAFALGYATALVLPKALKRGQQLLSSLKDNQVIRTEDALRRILGTPSKIALDKECLVLDSHCKNFVAMSPFIVLGTSNGTTGQQDVSPKGDPAGFVKVTADGTRILIPERVGNKRLDSLRNILGNDQVTVMFLVPGLSEMLRVMGRAHITTDQTLLDTMAIQGIAPKTAAVIDVDKVYFHCGKAALRSKLWDPSSRVEKSAFPGLGELLKAHADNTIDAAKVQEGISRRYEHGLYADIR